MTKPIMPEEFAATGYAKFEGNSLYANLHAAYLREREARVRAETLLAAILKDRRAEKLVEGDRGMFCPECGEGEDVCSTNCPYCAARWLIDQAARKEGERLHDHGKPSGRAAGESGDD